MPQTIKILLLGDQVVVQALLEHPLNQDGEMDIKFTHADTLDQAADLVMKEAPDLIMLDLEMPGGEGPQAYFRIKSMAPETAVVVMSGAKDKAAGIRAVRLGAQDCLIKGEDGPERLFSVIRHAMDRQEILKLMLELDRELSIANGQLQAIARTDPLTDLQNRRGLQEDLRGDAVRALAPDAKSLVMLVDVDDFKKVNDVLGHDAGDRVLKEIAERLKKGLRPTDHAARIGGDEYLLLLPDTLPDVGLEVAKRLRDAIGLVPFPLPTGPLTVTVSIGLVLLPQANPSIEDLLTLTHASLYQSKTAGKNRVSCDWQLNPSTP